MYGKLSANRSNESLRTRFDSSLSDRELRTSESPPLSRPIPQIPTGYLNIKFHTLFGKLNYLHSPIPRRMEMPTTSSELGNVFKPKLFQEPVKLKASKIYDKFSMNDLEEMQLKFNSSEKVIYSPKDKRNIYNRNRNFNDHISEDSDEKMLIDQRSSDQNPIQENSFMSLIKASNIRK
mmetsp:Transcript_17823/g.15732  ORF Transcript_17823/g.15732 Transcript_17823/m.15732 type:complete len:178 (+) Transcript_17823:32-565(+)